MQRQLPHRTVQLIVICVVISLVIAIASYRIVQNDYQNRLNESATQAEQITSFFSSETVAILQYAQTYIQSARREFLKYGIDGVQDFLDVIPPDPSIMSHVTIIDRDGTPKLVSGHEVLPGTSAADREYFIFHRAGKGEFFISKPHVGRNTGILTIRYALPIPASDGSFNGVIFAALKTEPFTEFFTALNLGPASSATLVGTDKKIRARSHYGRLGPGQDISGSQLWKELEKSQSGQYLQTSVVDGVTRYYSYEKIPDLPLVVAVGLALNDLEQQSRAFRVSIYAIAGLCIAIVWSLALFAIRDGYIVETLRREVSQRRRSETDLENVNTELMQFANSASHDLKGPLSSITGLLKLCVEDIDNGEFDVARQNTVKAIDISRRSATKVENVLKIAKAARDKIPPETINFELVIDQIWVDLASGLETPPTLTKHLHHNDPLVLEYPTLKIIMENLISNAIKYQDCGKLEQIIEINTRTNKNDFIVSVRDNGVGIAEDSKDEIFDLFSRIDHRSGDGLGLSLVKKHVDRMNGTIDVDTTLGHGTTFTLTIPLSNGGGD